MIKRSPSATRIATMVIFALSCFGLLLYLWLSFGGSLPLKPKGYRVNVAFPEAVTLGQEADVRVAGVTVGKVRQIQLDRGHNRSLATLELQPQYAPLRRDARAILRQKTLLGETYVELTLGRSHATIPEGGRLADGRVADTVQLDEILGALDARTRRAFQTWQQDLAQGIHGRGQDFNDALGTLPGFAHDATDVLAVLDAQRGALQRLVKNTGIVFGALTEHESQLRNLITSSKRVFDATASRHVALADTIRILPSFLDQSRATLARVQTFSTTTDPLIRELRPVARELRPTLRDVRALAPDLRRFFRNLDPLITASRTGIPAASSVLRGARPLLAAMLPFLEELNPVLQYLELSQWQVSDFLSFGAAALAAKTAAPGGGVGHYLRQFGPIGPESAAIYRERPSFDRGNSYPQPVDLYGPKGGRYKIVPQWDCVPSGGPREPSGDQPGCFTNPNITFQGRVQGRFPHVERAHYGGGG
jgi:virulence factor Mce-like protein